MKNQQSKKRKSSPIQLRIKDQELYRALKILSRQPKHMGYGRQFGSVAGVIQKFLLDNNGVWLKELAEEAQSGIGKSIADSSTALVPSGSGAERDRSKSLSSLPGLRTRNPPWPQYAPQNHTIKLSIPEKDRKRIVILDAPTRKLADDEAFAYAWFTLLCRSYVAFERKDMKEVNSWRRANELPDIKAWPGWAEMAQLVCYAYLEHSHYFNDWRDWAEG